MHTDIDPIPTSGPTLDLDLIERDLAELDTTTFAADFYDRLFAAAPQARPMFPADLADQQHKLTAELVALIGLARCVAAGNTDAFTRRTGALGRRHETYGAVAAHYDLVGATLIETLASALPDWDDTHRASWGALYATVAAAMQADAASAG